MSAWYAKQQIKWLVIFDIEYYSAFSMTRSIDFNYYMLLDVCIWELHTASMLDTACCARLSVLSYIPNLA